MFEYFKGIYYKHQKDGKTICIIPGRTRSSSFIQIITDDNSYHYNFKNLKDSGCSFGINEIIMNLPDISGTITYKNVTPIKYDIMGPFKFIPMECRHKILSMYHNLSGGLTVKSQYIDFTGGIGYIEGDSGCSFPKKYLWLHCNDFNEKCSIMLSVAHIPFCYIHFMGCIAIVYYKEKEYRFATYLGVKTVVISKNKVILRQGKYMLEIDLDHGIYHPLSSPKNGKMDSVIYESNKTKATFRLFENNELLFELLSNNTSFECEGID